MITGVTTMKLQWMSVHRQFVIHWCSYLSRGLKNYLRENWGYCACKTFLWFLMIIYFFLITLLDEIARTLALCQLKRLFKDDLHKGWTKKSFTNHYTIHIRHLLLPQAWTDWVVQWEGSGFGAVDPCTTTLQAVCPWAHYLTSLVFSFLRMMISIFKRFF